MRSPKGLLFCYILNMKLVYGIGVNDLTHPTKVNYVQLGSYKCWTGMIRRCYDLKFQTKHPSYIGCEVCSEWKLFSNFAKFYDLHWKPGLCLDKDILKQGNKIYSPELCRFIPNAINVLLTDNKSRRGNYPLGVSYIPKSNKYRVKLSRYGNNCHIGIFDSVTEAHNAWKTEKTKHIIQIANEYYSNNLISSEIRDALLSYDFE